MRKYLYSHEPCFPAPGEQCWGENTYGKHTKVIAVQMVETCKSKISGRCSSKCVYRRALMHEVGAAAPHRLRAVKLVSWSEHDECFIIFIVHSAAVSTVRLPAILDHHRQLNPAGMQRAAINVSFRRLVYTHGIAKTTYTQAIDPIDDISQRSLPRCLRRLRKSVWWSWVNQSNRHWLYAMSQATVSTEQS